MDSAIPIVVVLFVLSMICERVAEFFKNYLWCKKFMGADIVGDTLTKHDPQSPQEQRRTYRILKLNLVCGYITAFICHASIFDILSNLDNPGKALGWTNKPFFSLDTLALAAGAFFTGCFISLGSKFWHDLLDILLEVKNVKRSVATEITNVQGDFLALPPEEQRSVAESAILENKATWKNTIRNYAGVSFGSKLTGTFPQDTGIPAIRFNLLKKENLPADAADRVPDFIFFHGYKIPTDTIASGEAVATAEDSPDTLPCPLGSSIHRDGVTTSGTLGFRLKTGSGDQARAWGVSCYHVLFPQELKNGRRRITAQNDAAIIDSNEVFSPGTPASETQERIGFAERGEFNEFLDVAFFETTNDLVSDSVVGGGHVNKVHALKKSDQGTLAVKFFGKHSGLCTGTVHAIRVDQQITYFPKSLNLKHELNKLVQVKAKAQPGDSGAALLTEDNELVGMVVAADDQFTYAIPYTAFAENFPVTI